MMLVSPSKMFDYTQKMIIITVTKVQKSQQHEIVTITGNLLTYNHILVLRKYNHFY